MCAHCSNVNVSKTQNPRYARDFSVEDFLKGVVVFLFFFLSFLRFNQHPHLLLSLRDHYKSLKKECYQMNMDGWLLSSLLLMLAGIQR